MQRAGKMKSKSVTFWLKKACGSEVSSGDYRRRIERFFEYFDTEPDNLLLAWKKVKYDYRLREKFIDEWTEKIEDYVYNKYENYAPATRMQELAVAVSFFKHHRISVEPDREKHAYVKYHNRDITKEEIRRILEHANIRDRTFFLMMLESGLRPNTLVQLRYKHIKKDIETNRVPMMIELPSELLKDRVSARWTFIGEDAFKSLKEYLKTRIPLKNEDLIFTPERSDVKRECLVPTTFTNKFGGIALKLGITEREEKGKPRKIRLYCLRKYFNNELRYEGFDPAYKEFWMGHETTQTHYVSRDIEKHREIYAKAYTSLRIYKPKTELTPKQVEKLEQKLAEEIEAKIRAEYEGKFREIIQEKMQKINNETMKEIEKLKQAYQQGMQELEMELKKERTIVSNLSKIIQPLIKKQMRKLGQKVGKEMKQTETESKQSDK